MNPILKARKATGLSRRRFALALGVSYDAVWAAEAGHPRRLTKGIREGLAAAGFDAAKLADDYATWRERKQADTLEALG